EAERRRASEQRSRGLVEQEEERLLPALRGRVAEAHRKRRLARSRGTREDRARPAVQSAAEKRIKTGEAARAGRPLERSIVADRDEPREDRHAACTQHEIVLALAETRTPQLLDGDLAARDAVFRGRSLEGDHPVRDALHVLIRLVARAIIENQYRDLLPGEVALELEHLPAVAQRR